jgi:hypothetical protein
MGCSSTSAKGTSVYEIPQRVLEVFMQRLTVGFASALVVAGTVAPAVMANMHQEDQAQSMAVPSTEEVAPFDLTYFTYAGGLEDFGIEGGNFLIDSFRSGEVSAQDIVETAVAQDFVSEDALTDPLYVDRVDDFLESLTRFDP